MQCTPRRYPVALSHVDLRSSMAATYDNLRDLVGAGLVSEVAVEGRAAWCDARGSRHHHFICHHRGNVEDIEWFEVSRRAPRFWVSASRM